MTQNIQELERKARELREESEKLLQESNKLRSIANAVGIDEKLRNRLSPLHYQLINELSTKDLVELGMAKDWYLEAKENSRNGKIYLLMMKGDILYNGPRKSLQGASYPRKSLVGYYAHFSTAETCGQSWEDSIFLNPGLPVQYDISGLIEVPMDAIESYRIIERYEEKNDISATE